MPTFANVSVSVIEDDGFTHEHEVDVDFEVFCAECNAGICGLADTRKSHRRGTPQISMSLCEKCKRGFESEIADRDQTIKDLEQEVDDLKAQLSDAQGALDEAKAHQ